MSKTTSNQEVVKSLWNSNGHLKKIIHWLQKSNFVGCLFLFIEWRGEKTVCLWSLQCDICDLKIQITACTTPVQKSGTELFLNDCLVAFVKPHLFSPPSVQHIVSPQASKKKPARSGATPCRTFALLKSIDLEKTAKCIIMPALSCGSSSKRGEADEKSQRFPRPGDHFSARLKRTSRLAPLDALGGPANSGVFMRKVGKIDEEPARSSTCLAKGWARLLPLAGFLASYAAQRR